MGRALKRRIRLARRQAAQATARRLAKTARIEQLEARAAELHASRRAARRTAILFALGAVAILVVTYALGASVIALLLAIVFYVVLGGFVAHRASGRADARALRVVHEQATRERAELEAAPATRTGRS